MRLLLPLLPLFVACTPDDRPSILLVTFDTTRADRLGPYGGDVPTPTWDALAARGTVFERAYSTAPLTTPSHSSMLSGRTPLTHGVRDNGSFILDDEVVTLPERLGDAGYDTLAFTSAFPTSARWNLDQGFATYRDGDAENSGPNRWMGSRPADDTVDEAIAAMEDVDGPAFVWVHLFDAHYPYAPPSDFAQAVPGDPYGGEIAFADHQAGRLLDAIQGDRPWITVFTADHGEGFGEGGEKTHGFLLHDGTIRVPLVVAGPGIAVGRTDAVVSHVDLAPTLLDLAGLPLHPGLEGKDLRQGGSGYTWSEATSGLYALGMKPLFAGTEANGRYTEGQYGLFYPYEAGRVAIDPGYGADVNAHALRLAAFIGDHPSPTQDNRVVMDPDELAQLAALGYLSATSQPAIDVDPRDVIERIPLLWRSRQLLSDGKLDLADTAIKRLEQLLPDAAGVVTLRADWLSASGQPEEAYERLIHVFTRAPGPQLAMSLGRLAEELGAPDAESWYREALLAVPGLPEALAGLARLALADGDLAEAEALSLQLAGESPDAVEVNLMLAEASLARGELALAEREARAALVKRPLHPWALDLLARVTWERGRPEEALELTFDLLRERPTDGVVRARLSRWLLDVGRAAEALRVLRNARSTADQVPEFARLRGEAEAMLGLPPSEPVEP